MAGSKPGQLDRLLPAEWDGCLDGTFGTKRGGRVKNGAVEHGDLLAVGTERLDGDDGRVRDGAVERDVLFVDAGATGCLDGRTIGEQCLHLGLEGEHHVPEAGYVRRKAAMWRRVVRLVGLA